MKLLDCNNQCISTKDISVCGLPAIGKLRTLGEADSLNTSTYDLQYYDYLTIEEEEAYGENN